MQVYIKDGSNEPEIRSIPCSTPISHLVTWTGTDMEGLMSCDKSFSGLDTLLPAALALVLCKGHNWGEGMDNVEVAGGVRHL